MSAVVFCSKCQSENAEGSAYCTNCGAPLPQTMSTSSSVSCPQCGFRNEGEHRFCIKCGASLAEVKVDSAVAQPAISQTNIFCPSCGASNLEGSEFCNKCGASLTDKAGILAAAREETSWAWWLLPIFLWWVGGVIAWISVKKRNPSKARGLLWLGIGFSVLWLIFIFIAATS
jgi:uncharacterized membrane protein YvbJ